MYHYITNIKKVIMGGIDCGRVVELFVSTHEFPRLSHRLPMTFFLQAGLENKWM